jgi:hypothetical protein
MRFKILLLSVIIGWLLLPGQAYAQGAQLDTAESNTIINQCATKFPKFYREFKDIQKRDPLIKNIIFVRNQNLNGGPARASARGNIFIDVKYLENEQPGFDDNRLIVVLYHEVGHLHYFVTVPPLQRNIMQNEKYAFEYSLSKTKQMADNGDCLPLKTGLKFMKLRSEGTNLQDPHVRALKLMVTEAPYAEYLQYVREKCP